MENCLKSILPGGEEIEILIIDDGSTDRTAEIADGYEKKYPTICRVIHQENGGHGEAVNTGIRNARGIFFKVVDSDDRVDYDAYMKILAKLRELACGEPALDMFIANYVYDKAGVRHKKIMRMPGFPKNRLFAWNDVKFILKGHYMLMHSIIYRTELLRGCGLELPKHTFYVDNIYAYTPLPEVRTMYYMDVDFYRYFIGREDQSVNFEVMLGRMDQQLRINRIMIDSVDLRKIAEPMCRKYMLHYLELITCVSSILLLQSHTEEDLQKKRELWEYIRHRDIGLYRLLRRRIMGFIVNIPGKPGIMIAVAAYKILRKTYGFN